MKPLKAPRLDDLHALFYQHQWEIMGESFCKIVWESFDGVLSSPSHNSNMITLFPKTEYPKNLTEFMPISLCSISYKVITKHLANR